MSDDIVQRWYQEDAIKFTINDLIAGFNPVVGLPTGSGKSIVLCGLAEQLIDRNLQNKILILSHVKEILQQNHKALTEYFYGIDIGLYSSGLKSKTINKITVAGIQSAQNNPQLFKDFDYVLIDEAHRVSFDDETGYRKFLKQIDAQCVGLTATPYRTKGGYLYNGENGLFNKISIDMTTGENFNRLIEEGYLSEIYSKKTALKLDVKGIKTIGGDYASKQCSERFDRENITEAAVMEVVHYGKNYKHWLCFAIDIKHAENIARHFRNHGITAIAVHSKMKGRDEAIAGFKSGKYRVLVNVDILTTGFDFPQIDLIIILRPTKSPIIHVQIPGRGLRVFYAEGYDLSTIEGRLEAIDNSTKTHCLVFDFAGNGRRLGPINDVKIKKPGTRSKEEGAMLKSCKECGIENHLSAKVCCNCGAEFETKEIITSKTQDIEIVSKVKKKKEENKPIIRGWARVDNVTYARYQKAGTDLALIVEYHCGMIKHKEYVFIEGRGKSKYFANNWMNFRWNEYDIPQPKTVQQCLNYHMFIKKPKEILVDNSGKFTRILESRFR